MLQTPGQVAQQPFGLVCVVLVPGLTERLLDARMQMQGQALDDVTALVDLAALDGGGHTEGVADRATWSKWTEYDTARSIVIRARCRPIHRDGRLERRDFGRGQEDGRAYARWQTRPADYATGPSSEVTASYTELRRSGVARVLDLASR